MLRSLYPLHVDDVLIMPDDEGITISGVLSMRSPSDTITPYFKRVHTAAIAAGIKRITVDLRGLSFMNSSSIRALVDWVEWIRRESSERQYVLCFISDDNISWQTTTLAAVRALDEDHVEVRSR